jgi:hypothetical protein
MRRSSSSTQHIRSLAHAQPADHCIDEFVHVVHCFLFTSIVRVHIRLVNIYGINSQALEAVSLFYRSRAQLSGNTQSIWISVLTACAHGGLVHEAQKIFDDIPHEQRSVKIWNSLVKMIFVLTTASRC